MNERIQKVSLSFFKAFSIHQKISQIVVQKCILFLTPFKLFVWQKVGAAHYLMKEYISRYVRYVQVLQSGTFIPDQADQ